jgi:hypothetical protein
MPSATARKFLGLSACGVVQPYFIARLSALPVEAVYSLAAPRVVDALSRIRLLEQRFNSEWDTLASEFHDAVGAISDPHCRNRVLAARRVLKSQKRIAPARWEEIEAFLPIVLCQRLKELQTLIVERDETIVLMRELYHDAVRTSRGNIQAAIADPAFAKGVLLSSPTLFKNLARYAAADPARFTSRDEQIERGILRYLTRAATKATPFATFCAVVPGELVEHDGAPNSEMRIDGDLLSRRSMVRLNKRLYGALWMHIKSQRTLRRSLHVMLNPTVDEASGRLTFLAPANGTESFRRLAFTDAVRVVATVVGTQGATLGELAGRLVASPDVEATDDEADAYLNRLVDIGFLRFRAAVDEQVADWIKPLRTLLDSIDDQCAQTIAAFLGRLDHLVVDYETANVARRAQISETISREITETFGVVGAPVPAALDPILYEDMTADATVRVALSDPVRSALKTFASYVRATLWLASQPAEQATMRYFFDNHYGPGVGAVPLLTFYEDYYREHYKEHLSKAAKLRNADGAAPYDAGNPFRLEIIERMRCALHDVTELLRAKWSADAKATEIHIDVDELTETLKGLPSANAGVSTAAFCQVVPGTGRRPLVRIVSLAGQHYAGYGKYFSRFLDLMPDAFRERVARDNDRMSPALLAEICGDAQFNANLHPPLLSAEISYPTGESGPTTSQLSIVELDVVREAADPYRLSLVHRMTGRYVEPIDLGFLNPRMRPPLYQLLSNFSRIRGFRLPLPERPDSRGPSETTRETDATPSSVTQRPRIVLGETIVLSRRFWEVASEAYPRPLGGEGTVDYFVRVDRWRNEHGIPKQVYISLTPQNVPGRRTETVVEASRREAVEATSPNEPGTKDRSGDRPTVPSQAPPRTVSAPARRGRDWKKPQFIDFSSPALVRLFAVLPGDLSQFRASLVECLPAREVLPGCETTHFASELILQMNFPEDTAEASSNEHVIDRELAVTE